MGGGTQYRDPELVNKKIVYGYHMGIIKVRCPPTNTNRGARLIYPKESSTSMQQSQCQIIWWLNQSQQETGKCKEAEGGIERDCNL